MQGSVKQEAPPSLRWGSSLFINEVLKSLKITSAIKVQDTVNELEDITNSAKNFIVLRKEINNYIEEKGKIL